MSAEKKDLKEESKLADLKAKEAGLKNGIAKKKTENDQFTFNGNVSSATGGDIAMVADRGLGCAHTAGQGLHVHRATGRA